MKKIFATVFAAAALLSMSSCSDFLFKEPINQFAAESYFATPTQLEMYCNGFIESWLPDPREVNGSDAYNDLIATKTSSDFFRGDSFWDNTKQGGWSNSNWKFARRINYMLAGMEKNAKGKISDEDYKHYEGVARFWRAYNYMTKVQTFSDVPWLDHVLDPIRDIAILYGPRDDREFVFHKMVEDLEFARVNVKPEKDEKSSTAISKWVVNALASRIYLYEASFRKYYPVNPATGKAWNNQYETSADLFALAAAAAKEVIDNGGYSLVPMSSWASLFVTTTNTKEVLWARPASGGKHAYTRYFNSNTLGQQYSATKPLVRMFLNADGTPTTTGEVSWLDEFTGRDPRLSATILGPDHDFKALSGEIVKQKPNYLFCKTGYQIIKFSIADETHLQNAVDESDVPLLRYAEVLLNYAEAQAELNGGNLTADEWNLTVGALRQRALGIATTAPATADPFLVDYYTSNNIDGKTLSATILEIRRERATELCFEDGLRQDDIYRWGQADLIERRYNHEGWQGIWVSDDEAANGFAFGGSTFTFNGKDNKETAYPNTGKENLNWNLEKAGAGYYLVYHYDLKWDDRMYVRPIPLAATNINPKLGQNYGW